MEVDCEVKALLSTDEKEEEWQGLLGPSTTPNGPSQETFALLEGLPEKTGTSRMWKICAFELLCVLRVDKGVKEDAEKNESGSKLEKRPNEYFLLYFFDLFNDDLLTLQCHLMRSIEHSDDSALSVPGY